MNIAARSTRILVALLGLALALAGLILKSHDVELVVQWASSVVSINDVNLKRAELLPWVLVLLGAELATVSFFQAKWGATLAKWLRLSREKTTPSQQLLLVLLAAHCGITLLLANYLGVSLGKQLQSAFRLTDQEMVDANFGSRIDFVRALKEQTSDWEGILIVTDSYWPYLLSYEAYPRRLYRSSSAQPRPDLQWLNNHGISWIAEINEVDERWFSLRRVK